MSVTLVVIYSLFWLAWIAYWFVKSSDAQEIKRYHENRFLNLLLAYPRIFFGYKLQGESLRYWRFSAFGVFMFFLPVIIVAIFRDL